MISLQGKRILVTGGSRGIGRATALLCAKAGADVGITYHTRRADADAVAKAVRAMGRRAYVGGGDLGEGEVGDLEIHRAVLHVRCGSACAATQPG